MNTNPEDLSFQDETLWKNKRYAIVRREYNDGSVAIIGGRFAWPKEGVPYFVEAIDAELPKYVVDRIRNFALRNEAWAAYYMTRELAEGNEI